MHQASSSSSSAAGSPGVPATGERLLTGEHSYRRMLDEIQDYAIILLNREGIIQTWNKGAEKIKQYTEEDAVGKSFRMFYLPEDRQRQLPEKLIAQAADTGRALHEGWRLRKDQSRFWGSVTLTALHDSENRVIGFSKITRDLTERKLVEDQLRLSEERYHKMIAEVQDYAIILLDLQGNIQNWNEGAGRIKGYDAAEAVGMNFRNFYTDEDRTRGLPEQLLAEAVRAGKAVHEGWRVRKDGTRFWGNIVITALHADDGSVIGFSKVTRDLTERKQAEDKINVYLLELEAQNKELEQFAYLASHDLQEPLRKIRMFVDLIETNFDDKEVVRGHFQRIIVAASRMSELIKSILNYSKISKDDIRVPTNLNDVLADVISFFELSINEKKAVIHADKLPVITAIPFQVHQLLSNLISNALKFSENVPRITITARVISKHEIIRRPVHLDDELYTEIVVQDNGIGFAQQYEPIIFGMFQRLHTRDSFSGTGIGLALCKKIMDNHNGFITANSTLGKGTSFYIYFPLLVKG